MLSPRRGMSPLGTSKKGGRTTCLPAGTQVKEHGIPPIAKSTIWGLVGHGAAYDDCGRFGWKGCLNVEAHNVPHLDDNSHIGRVFVKGFRRSCDRAECPVCFEKWASRASVRVEKRLKLWKSGYRKAIHVTASVPPDLDIDYVKLRILAVRLLKESGMLGGVCVFHPFRKDARGWYESPHFHTIGYGWIVGTKQIYERTGWVIKNVGVRKTVRGTISYQLSHAGFHLKHHTITWFGALSYNQFHVDIPVDKEVCPICSGPLYAIRFIGGLDRPPPEVERSFYDSPGDWIKKVC